MVRVYRCTRCKTLAAFAHKNKKGRREAVPISNQPCHPAGYCFGGATGAFVLPAFSLPGGGPPGWSLRDPIRDVFCHLSNCSGVRTAFICWESSSAMALRLACRSFGVRLVSLRKSTIFCPSAFSMASTFVFWSAVRLSSSASRSIPAPGGRPAGGAPAGGVEGGVLVSPARKAGPHTSKLPTANAAINIVLFAFIILCRGCFSILPRPDDAIHYLSDVYHNKRLQSVQHFCRCLHGLFNVRGRVRRGNKTRLELRGCQINAFGQHPVEILFEPLAVTLHRVG